MATFSFLILCIFILFIGFLVISWDKLSNQKKSLKTQVDMKKFKNTTTETPVINFQEERSIKRANKISETPGCLNKSTESILNPEADYVTLDMNESDSSSITYDYKLKF